MQYRQYKQWSNGVTYCSLLLHHFHKPNHLTKKEAKIEFYLKVDILSDVLLLDRPNECLSS